MELIAKRYFSLIIASGAILGLFVPSVGVKLTSLVMPSLFILMLFTVLKIDLYKTLHAIKKPLPLIVAIVLSYIAIPLILYLISDIFHLNEKEKLSVMFSALAPSILSAPYFVHIMKGDVEFSFVLSIILTLLAPFLIPLELYYLFEKSIDFPLVSVLESIFIIVFIPIFIVQVMKKLCKNLLLGLSNYESRLTAIMFFIFIWAIISVNSSEILNNHWNYSGIWFFYTAEKNIKVFYE